MNPFAQIDKSRWIASNELAFAIRDGFPVSPGHCLVVTRRTVKSWEQTTPLERIAMLQLVESLCEELKERHSPDGFNIGVNLGEAAGQTIPQPHVHVIPRYVGDVEDATGGVRGVIPGKANYLSPDETLPRLLDT